MPPSASGLPAICPGAYRETQMGGGETEGGGEYWEKSTVFVKSLTKCPKRDSVRLCIW